jgi:hypothetical protein
MRGLRSFILSTVADKGAVDDLEEPSLRITYHAFVLERPQHALVDDVPSAIRVARQAESEAVELVDMGWDGVAHRAGLSLPDTSDADHRSSPGHFPLY